MGTTTTRLLYECDMIHESRGRTYPFLRILYPIHIKASKSLLYPVTITAKNGFVHVYMYYILYLYPFVPKVDQIYL
jgi:hypothetical protein